MAAFGINAICPSTASNDWHYFGYATTKTTGQLFEVGHGSARGGTGPLVVYGNRDVVMGLGTSAVELATTATGGFPYIPTCAGAPTGVPTRAAAGFVPLVFDRTNNKLYAYDGGWIGVTLS